jgi:hypothetical protein
MRNFLSFLREAFLTKAIIHLFLPVAGPLTVNCREQETHQVAEAENL